MCERCEDREKQLEILNNLELEKLNKDYHVRKKMELLDKLEKAEKLILKGKYDDAANILEDAAYYCKVTTY